MNPRSQENNSRFEVRLPLGKRRSGSRRVITLHGAAIALLSVAVGFSGISAQVFRGYYQSGGLEITSDRRDAKKIIKSFYPDGKLEALYEYEDGKLNGVARQYYANGVLKTETRYKNDKRDGLARFFYSSGMLKARIEYRDDAQVGNPRYYDEKGKPIEVTGK